MDAVPRRLTPVPWPVLSALVLLFAAEVRADAIDSVVNEVDDIRQMAEALGPRYLDRRGFRGANYAAERLIDGENLYRMKDYQRASILFLDIIENYPNHPAYPDALYLMADSLFLSRDYLGAREWFRRLLDERRRSGIDRFRQRAIARLIEVSIHLGDFEGVEGYFDQLGRTPDAEARYVKGKYLYFKGDLDSARHEFGTILQEGALVAIKSAYFIGTILTRQGRYDEAIEMFGRGSRYEAKTPEEQEVVDLANLGMGRLYYEKDFVEHASEAYQRVSHTSPLYDTALYEAASVLIRAGYTIRAERVLEVLTVMLPDSRYIPRAKLLRGNLLLRTGRYAEAEKVFEETIDEFTPVMDQLDSAMREQQDPHRFFTDLVEASLSSLDVASALPPLVVKWVQEERDVEHALALASDLGVAREYVRETDRLVHLLEAVIDGPSRINAIPSLREAKRRAQKHINRLSQLRGRLLEIEQKEIGPGDAELQRLRRERADLEAQLAALPVSEEAFEKREREARQVYERMRQELSRNDIRLDQLNAMAVAIEHFSSDPRYVEGVPEQKLETVREELRRHREGIEGYRKELIVLRDSVEQARYQVGIGDSRDRSDEELRAKLRDLVKRERALVGGRGGKLGKKLEKAYAFIDSVERLLLEFERDIDAEAARQIEDMRRLVRAEREKVARYKDELRTLGDEAEEVVSGVTLENFSNVRKRFQELVLKADVGIIDVAWLRKEEHGSRIKELTEDRLKEIRVLDDDFREVKEERAAAQP